MVYETGEAMERLADERDELAAELERVKAERDEMVRFLIASEDLCQREDGTLYWESCGEELGSTAESCRAANEKGE